MINIGERLLVQGSSFPAYVESVEPEEGTDRIIIRLDWKEFGKSRVFLHDENVTWFRFKDVN